MQAIPSQTASGEQYLPALPPSTVLSGPIPLRFQASSWSASSVVEPFAPDGTQVERLLRERSLSDACPIAEGIGLAHDAGNLLGAIRLYCDLLALPGVLRTEHRHYAEELHQLSARSGSLIDRLLMDRVLMDRLLVDQQARPEMPRPPQRQARTEQAFTRGPAEQVLLADLVQACRGLLQTIAGTGPFLLAVEAGIEDYAVAVSREAVERILVNLTKNAVEARGTEEGQGAITVRVRSVPHGGAGRMGGLALSVEDRGRGMTEAAVRTLLEEAAVRDGVTPRSSMDKSVPTRGIGFRVVRELVAATGGDLRIRSRVGQGTTVEIVWACTEDTEAAGESG